MKQIREHEGREVAFITSYGSTNYGTRTHDSDNDYKVWLVPTFNDLYDGKNFSSAIKIDGDDYEFHDLRKLHNLISKANPAYLEMFEAKEVYINPKYQPLWDWIQANKNELANADIKTLLKASVGIMRQKLVAIQKDLPREATNEGFKRREKFGFDSKQLLHISRLSYIFDMIILGRNFNETVALPEKFVRDLLNIKENSNNLTKDGAIEKGQSIIDHHAKLLDKWLKDGENIFYRLENNNGISEYVEDDRQISNPEILAELREEIKKVIIENFKGD